METFYYVFILLAIIWESGVVKAPSKVFNFRERLKDVTESLVVGETDAYTPKQSSYIFFRFLYITWCLVGLFTSQWVLFTFIFMLGVIPKSNVFLTWLDAFLTLGLLFFILFNKYHLHLDIVSYIF